MFKIIANSFLIGLVLRFVGILIFLTTPFGCDNPERKTFHGSRGVISIDASTSWEIERDTGDKDYTEMILKGNGTNEGINIKASSRLLYDKELSIESSSLIVNCLRNAKNNFKKKGYDIRGKGRTDPLVSGSKTIVLVAKKEEDMISNWIALKGQRMYTLLIVVDVYEVSKDFELDNYSKKVSFSSDNS